MLSIWHCHYRIRKRLTAKTLKSEVLPAFCSPIMVMSISVALDSENHQHPSLFIVERGFAFSVEWKRWSEGIKWRIRHQGLRR